MSVKEPDAKYVDEEITTSTVAATTFSNLHFKIDSDYYSLLPISLTSGSGAVTGTLPIANGGTGATTASSALSNLSGGILTTAPTSGLEIGAATSITGALTLGSPLTIANGGTGLTSSPSMLTNLASTSSASILTASPRPGVTGTLPLGNGGTGATTAASALTNLGVNDYIVAYTKATGGTQWSYIKFDSGIAMCWIWVTHTTTIANSWGSGYISGSVTWGQSSWPFEFSTEPILFYGCANLTNGDIAHVIGEGMTTTTACPPSFYLARYLSTGSTAYKWRSGMLAIGRYK
jgi:hypothetical protein